jgi:RNA polymerase primary sigma factor
MDKVNNGVLTDYFKSVAVTGKPVNEFEVSKQIESFEIQLWTHVLNYLPSTWAILPLIKQILKDENESDSKQFELLEQKAQQVRDKIINKEKYRLFCHQVAKWICEIDIDKRILFTFNIRLKTLLNTHKRFIQKVNNLYHKIWRLRDSMIQTNLRLVITFARQFKQCGSLLLSDMIQEGNLGLIKAVDRFDYKQGYKLTTYAGWWIKYYMSRAIINKGYTIRVPVHIYDRCRLINYEVNRMFIITGKGLTEEEIVKITKINLNMVKTTYCLPNKSVPIDYSTVPYSHNLSNYPSFEKRPLSEVLCDPSKPLTINLLVDYLTLRRISNIIDGFDPVKKDILYRRFGLGGKNEETLLEISKDHKVSRERIRQIQNEALKRIKRQLRALGEFSKE